ncbi:hypothetical protein H7F15_11075 [Pontibacter sp. Tf4]|uniref:hypothetical protein n=1 Tax=Pontibacter sp. Tf4 TaxID=2761620 RepID=UPI00162A5D0D|nr:hypothetical protein [Pontibacter sp. Tf4]MBB6611580.1 hypothetical protein [Pontibacter sp. Tf4]
MKKILYTIAFILATGTIAHAQAPILQSEQEIADYMVLENDLLLFTRKEADGQYIYSERKQNWESVIQKEAALNTGTINTVIGRNEAGTELYVYQKNGRNEEAITFYNVKDGAFEKTGERKLPKLKNHSTNLGLHLSADKNTLVLSAELGKTHGYDDVYISQWENNRWTKPKNLGKTVNTRQPEFAPFVADETLYFTRKEGDKSLVYSAALTGNAISSEPLMLDEVVNNTGTYNSYYKKQGEQEFWISAATDKAFAIYTREPVMEYKEVYEGPVAEDDLSFADAVSGSQDPGSIKSDTKAIVEEDELADFMSHSASPHDAFVLDREEAEKNNMVTHQENGLTMHYLLNQVYMGGKQTQILTTYLKSLPKGATLNIKGMSDGLGAGNVKARVSKQRAQLLKAYIQQNFAAKNFKVNVDSKVWKEVGKHFRVAEIRVAK